MKTRLFDFKLVPSLFTLFFFTLFLFLGHWQWDRYHYKQQLLQQFAHERAAYPVDFAQWQQQANSQFTHISARGHFLNNKTLLLVNKTYQGQLGAEVITPLQIKSSYKIVLINRGWIPTTGQGQPLTPIQPVLDTVTITGYVSKPDRFTFILGNTILTSTNASQQSTDTKSVHPILIQKLDIKTIANAIHLSLLPVFIRLDTHSDFGFARSEWQPSTVLPQRHLGYCVQWIVMAIVLLVAYLVFSYRLRREKK